MKKKAWMISAITIAILALSYYMIGDPFIAYHNYRLKQSIAAISKPTVTLNEIVPFEWDTVYTFAPYTSRSEIEEIIGFKSNAIRETVSEGMVQLLFVKDSTVCGSICGYAENLGYSVHFSDKVELTDNKQFDVNIQDGIVYLTEK